MEEPDDKEMIQITKEEFRNKTKSLQQVCGIFLVCQSYHFMYFSLIGLLTYILYIVHFHVYFQENAIETIPQ